MTLPGEGQYNLNILKQIDVTESFMGLPQKDRECDDLESFDHCTKRHYRQSMIENCGCLPLAIWTDQVCYKFEFDI